MLLITFFALIAIPVIGLARNSEVAFEQSEGRAFAKWPATTASTIYRKDWRSGVENYVDDRFGTRGWLIQANSYLTVNVLHSTPLVRNGEQLAGTTQDTSQHPTSQEKTSVPTPPSAAASAAPTAAALDQAPPAAAITPPSTVATVQPWKENNVVIGKDGWYFLDQEGIIDNYRCLYPFSNDELKTIATRLEKNQKQLHDQGIDFYLLLVPDKDQVYPEYLPDTIQQTGQPCRYNQLVQYLRQNTKIKFVDALPILQKEKSQYRVYAKTGTHWNDIGAFVTYRALMQLIDQEYPSLKPADWSDFTISKSKEPGLDLARLLSLQNSLQEETIHLVPKQPRQAYESTVSFQDPNPNPIMNPWPRQVDNPNLPRALVFRDSFFNAISPFFAEHFSRSVSVWTHSIEQYIVDAEHPNIVVLEIVSRKLGPDLRKP